MTAPRVSIRTRYVTRPASNVGAILATGGGRSHKRTMNQAESSYHNHMAAARTLAGRLGYVDVTFPSMRDDGFVWVAATREDVRRDALRQFAEHGHDGYWDKMTRENCGACVLGGYGATRDTESGELEPNYAGWQRLYVRAGMQVPARFRAAFDYGMTRDDNESWRAELVRDVEMFGVFHESDAS